jgi:hypothetical protein
VVGVGETARALEGLSEKNGDRIEKMQKQAGHHQSDGAPLEEREIKVVYRRSDVGFALHSIFDVDFINLLDNGQNRGSK